MTFLDTHCPTVLILGANGRFGSAAAKAFSTAGWNVLAQARRPLKGLPQEVEHVTASLDDPARLANAASGAHWVVHAASAHYPDWATLALPLFRRGMDVAERLEARLLLPGNVYNFGEGMPAVLQPNTPQHPTTVKGEIRRQMEAELIERAAAGRLKSTVLRAGDFFGGGVGNWFDAVIVKHLLRGRLIYPGPRDVAHAWAYLPDLASAAAAVASSKMPRPNFDVLHFAGHTVTGQQLLDTVELAARHLRLTSPDRPLLRTSLPWSLVRLAGLVARMPRAVGETRYLWRVPHQLDERSVVNVAGPVHVTPFDLAITNALQLLFTDGPNVEASSCAPSVSR